ncbi:PMD domain-containing protein [Cephalotus follicularis]|uniref:PMD domain-containing protein n=1 Tax=Cephalotus follicularis TaxID=3775 RepID=A0A1Q3D1Y7_CEPFO|nr:PMD domain-containing protein [Cephalotus follicularis]
MVQPLTSSLKASNVGSIKAIFSSWIKYNFGIPADEKNGFPDFEKGKSYNPKLNLAAFICFWLSKYVFLGQPVDGVNISFFLLVIKIANGQRFPLAHLFVGSLFKRLDLYKKSMEASLGCNSVLCFVDIISLRVFLWDHYKGYAPKVVNRKVDFRA